MSGLKSVLEYRNFNHFISGSSPRVNFTLAEKKVRNFSFRTGLLISIQYPAHEPTIQGTPQDRLPFAL
ncbi:MAG: hypothetical protein KJO21_01970 [Verrucomicrobiae bacterium]|nr:hypothetical protein [Verrucomicrobiae bacterium]NNJ44065.1 hypothetical protein [Akkermansiaceae bacterium]